MSEFAPLTVPTARDSSLIARVLSGTSGIWIGCAIVLAAVWGSLIWTVEYGALRQSRHNQQQVRLEANGFADYLAIQMLMVDRMLTRVRGDYQATGRFPARSDLAAELGGRFDTLQHVAITDRNGTLVASTAPAFEGISLSDRGYFRALAADPTDRLVIGESMVIGKLSGKPGVQLAKPVLSPKGEFLGVIAVGFDPNPLRRYFAGSDLFARRGLAVVVGRDDAIVRVRFSKDGTTSGDSLLTSRGWRNISTQESGSGTAPSVIDQVERHSAFHRVGSYPLVVGVAYPTVRAWSLAEGNLHLALTMTIAFSLALVLLARSRARLDAEQREIIQRLDESRQKELEANKMKSKFLATVSHELRTPLNSIIGFSELIRDEGCGPETRKFAGLIHDSGQHLHTLVNTLLDLAKIEAGKMEVDLAELDLRELLETVTDTHRLSIKTKDLTLSLSMSPPGPMIINTDRAKLVEVLNNVLHNSIKFTRSGQIAVTSFPVPGGVLIRVVDTGRGITAADMARVFERFNTIGDEPQGQKGSGLGLALSKSLMELMGGTITLQSQSGAGTQVDIVLPIGKQL